MSDGLKFKPDPDLQHEVEGIAANALDTLRTSPPMDPSERGPLVCALFEALGTMEFMGTLDAWLADHQRDYEELKAEIPTLMESLPWEGIQQTAMLFVIVVLNLHDAVLTEQDEGLPYEEVHARRAALETKIVEDLSERHRVELALAGAEKVQGANIALTADQASILAAHDGIVSENLWMTLPLGDKRVAMYVWAKPDMRSRLWWWSRGAHLPENALDALSTTADLLSTFPDARSELEKLIKVSALFQRCAESVSIASKRFLSASDCE